MCCWTPILAIFRSAKQFFGTNSISPPMQRCKALYAKNGPAVRMGQPCFDFSRKLRSIKSALKTWSKSKFSNFRSQVEKNTNKLHLVESKLLADPQSFRLNDWYFRLLKQREKLLLFNKHYWGSLARKKWLVDGDRNSRFFHQTATTRKRGCSIPRIKDTAGIWLEELPAIQQKFIMDFSSHFTSLTVAGQGSMTLWPPPW